MEYEPGVCNIGPAQQRRRLLLGVGSLLVAVVLVVVVLALGWSRPLLILSVFPLYGAALGLLQYRARFCVGFGGIGVFDTGDGTTRVTDPDAVEADRRRAVRLNTKAALIGIVATVVVYGVATVGL